MKKLSDPITSKNLIAWLVLGTPEAPEQPLPDYAVLEEAMAANLARVHETGSVNELLVENLADCDLFIHAGDVVSGGRQDRTLGADFIVPKHSGKVPVPAFCVEAARWHRRRDESMSFFNYSDAAAASIKLRKAMHMAKSQADVWKFVKEEQEKLSASLGASAVNEESPTSLHLTHTMGATRKAIAEIAEPFEAAALPPNSTGVVWAINGRLHHADLYGTPALFHKLWKKLARAAATEAIAEARGAKPSPAPETGQVQAWLEAASTATASQIEELPPRTKMTIRRGRDQASFETQDLAAPLHPIHTAIIEDFGEETR